MNKLVHEQSRLKILTLLASDSRPAAFTRIRDELRLTAGNLSIQLKTLEAASYVKTDKYFADNKPRTDVTLTDTGKAALMEYLDELEAMIAGIREKTT